MKNIHYQSFICDNESNDRLTNFWCKNDDHFLAHAVNLFDNRCSFPPGNHYSNSFIPKTLHFIWIGSILPEVSQRIIETWRSFHSSWDIVIWTDEAIDKLSIASDAMYLSLPNFGMKSDLLRYEILHLFGGVYVDVDYECLASIDDCDWFSCCSGFVCMSNTAVSVEINNGIIGCVAGHELASRLREGCRRNLAASPAPSTTLASLVNHPARGRGRGDADLCDNRITSCLTALLGHALPPPPPIGTDASAMDTVRKTGPGLLTKTVADMLELSAAGCAGSSECPQLPLLVLPYYVFHAVPNTSSLSPALLGSDEHARDVRRQLVDRYAVPVPDPDPRAQTDSDVDTSPQEPFSVAVHWWQCSWQDHPRNLLQSPSDMETIS